LTAALAPTTALACGESMFLIGKGVHYRAYSAPIPGTVLVYARSDDERAVAEQLRAAGHKVLVVDSDVELSLQLEQNDVDVIVAPASKRVAVEAGAAGLSVPPDWVPVYQPHEKDLVEVRAVYGGGVSSDDEIRKYLKAIHRNLRNHKS
jgi:hypothetical protein